MDRLQVSIFLLTFSVVLYVSFERGNGERDTCILCLCCTHLFYLYPARLQSVSVNCREFSSGPCDGPEKRKGMELEISLTECRRSL